MLHVNLLRQESFSCKFVSRQENITCKFTKTRIWRICLMARNVTCKFVRTRKLYMQICLYKEILHINLLRQGYGEFALWSQYLNVSNRSIIIFFVSRKVDRLLACFGTLTFEFIWILLSLILKSLILLQLNTFALFDQCYFES